MFIPPMMFCSEMEREVGNRECDEEVSGDVYELIKEMNEMRFETSKELRMGWDVSRPQFGIEPRSSALHPLQSPPISPAPSSVSQLHSLMPENSTHTPAFSEF